MKKMRCSLTALIAALTLCACGGGGGGNNVVPTQPTGSPGSPAASQTVKFVVSVPAAGSTSSAVRVKPAYVSTNTGSVRITLQSVNGAPPSAASVTVAAISGTAPGCSADSQKNINCTIPVQAPAGLDLFSIATYQSPDASGAVLASTTVSANAGGTSASTVPVSLGGVPARVSFSPTQLPMVADGAIHRFAVTLNVTDASGATIVGASSYQSPVSLQVLNDPAHALTLSTTSVMTPGTVVTVTYDSNKQLVQGQIVASDNGMPSVSLNAAPLTLNPSPLTVFDDAVSTPVTLTEGGFTGSYAVSVANANDASVTVANGPLNSGTAVATIVPKTHFDVTNLTVNDGNVSDVVSLAVIPHNGKYTTFGSAHTIFPSFSIVEAADGTFWTTDSFTGSIVSFNPSTGAYTSHVVDPSLMGPEAVALDGAGNVWFADSTQIGEYVVSNGTINYYSTGLSPTPKVNSIIAGPAGTMWFYDLGANNATSTVDPTYFGSIDTTTGLIQEYQTNTPAVPKLAEMPMVLAPDNSIWYGNALNNSIGRIDTSSGTMTEFKLGTPAQPQLSPMQLVVTPDGKIWAGCYSFTSSASAIVSVDTKNNNAVTYYTQGFAQAGFIYSMILGSDGNLWFSEIPASGTLFSSQALIGVMNRTTGAIYQYPPMVPEFAQITGLIDRGDGTLWMLDSGFGNIGKVTFK